MGFGQLGSPEGGIVPLVGVTTVACGGFHSMFLTFSGRLYACGANSFGQLGLGDRKSRQEPCLVNLGGEFVGDRVVSMSLGFAFSFLQTARRAVLSCGFAKNGRCAIEDSTIPDKSEDGFPLLLFFRRCKVFDSMERPLLIACGSGHALALGQGGRVYSWGRNDQGQCGSRVRMAEILEEFQVGVESEPFSHLPQCVLEDPQLNVVFAGAYHSVAARLGSSLVYGWGSNSSGESNPSISDKKIPLPSKWGTKHVAIAFQPMSSDTLVVVQRDDERQLLLNGHETRLALSPNGGRVELALPFGIVVDRVLFSGGSNFDKNLWSVLVASASVHHCAFVTIPLSVLIALFK